jgi:ubiquinol-cytochrome c reductase cytochrome b subunit
MGASIVVLALLPWVDRGRVKSVRYRCGFHKWNIAGFVVTFVLLGWVGATPQTDLKTIISQVCTVTYFMFFVLLFVYSKNEKTKPLPERLTK